MNFALRAVGAVSRVSRIGSLRAFSGIQRCTSISSVSSARPISAALRLQPPLVQNNRQIHTKGERELVEFLTEEILAERKAQKVKNIPTELDGFQVKLDGAEVTLTKKAASEKVSVSFNINHTVDSEDQDDEPSTSEKSEEFTEMRSKPQFEVDISRGDETLSFTCSFIQDGPVPEGEGYNDVFGIDEVTMYKGEWNDKVYAIAGDVLDGYLYDLLMNYLEEKGVSNEFAEKLSDLSTAYEHSAYICLLESLSKFTATK